MKSEIPKRRGSLLPGDPAVDKADLSLNAERLYIRAFRTLEDPLPIVPAPPDRAWMNDTKQSFANRCLPLRMANQCGWLILNSHTIRISWDGGAEPSATKVVVESGSPTSCPISHFGHGIVTWRIPYLFRTSRGFNLVVRGPTNWFKDGIAPLDAIVETDWAVATFTMNWKITRPNANICFAPGDPICMIIPQPRGQTEQFLPDIQDLESEPNIKAAHNNWAESRSDFLSRLNDTGSDASLARWQKHYFKGTSPLGISAQEHQHQVKIPLLPFAPEWDGLSLADLVRTQNDYASKEPRCMATQVVLSTQSTEDIHADNDSSAHPSFSSLTPGFLVASDFLSAAAAMRSEFEAHFSDPYGRYGSYQEVWDYWYVPDMYTYLRTDPKRVFSPDLIDYFLETLSAWALAHLGLSKVSRPYLSLYINGCGQGLHNDSSNGRFGYVFSLTDWTNRRFGGGETLIFRETPYWSSPRIRVSGAGTEFYELVPSAFNQLLVFDDRLIHAVRQIQGSMDPREGRLVLHGHISEGGISVTGSLGQQEVEEMIADVATELLADAVDVHDYQGVLTLRLEVEADGRIDGVKVLCNRLLPISPSAPDSCRAVPTLIDRFAQVRFRPTSGPTSVVLPIIVPGGQDEKH